jgi:hypothetical protein
VTVFEKPPEDIPPEELFRLITRRPYPVIPISIRLRGAESIALSVRALTWCEEMEIQDLHSQKESTLSLAYIAKSLMADGEQAFSSYEQASMLSESEIQRLEPEVALALSKVCPCVFRSDMSAWEFALYEGAKHLTNAHAVSMAMSCIEDGSEMVTQRPDRFYNMPLLELTEGHALAFRSACKVIWEARDEYRERSKNKRR